MALCTDRIEAGAGLHWNQSTYHQIQHGVHGEGGVAREEGPPVRAREGSVRAVFISPVHVCASSLPRQ